MSKVPVEITLEFTPNPNSLKYVLNRRLLLVGTENYTTIEDAKDFSPLAYKLFLLEDVNGVMIGQTFITVTISKDDNIRELNKSILSTIKEHLESGEIIYRPKPQDATQLEDSEISLKIRRIIDEEIRPAVAMDGGDITFERYVDKVVYLNMVGACSGCPSSVVTRKMGIQNRLQKEIPEIEDVVPI